MGYDTNTAADGVKNYTATAVWNGSTKIYDVSLSSANYAAGQLYKNITKNENWTSGTDNTTEEFSDKEGQLVLKRTYDAGQRHDTYYVYDQFGNLSYVFPPLADNPLAQLEDLCYQYKYDHRNRLVEKSCPAGNGSSWLTTRWTVWWQRDLRPLPLTEAELVQCLPNMTYSVG
ncbi:hypothetical protein H9W95_02265 [Flavobacterium lindanitolerans]|nr:hypothetical protein [Flavobacterium lindanitolerans]